MGHEVKNGNKFNVFTLVFRGKSILNWFRIEGQLTFEYSINKNWILVFKKCVIIKTKPKNLAFPSLNMFQPIAQLWFEKFLFPFHNNENLHQTLCTKPLLSIIKGQTNKWEFGTKQTSPILNKKWKKEIYLNLKF
jgi:hypothetical protein